MIVTPRPAAVPGAWVYLSVLCLLASCQGPYPKMTQSQLVAVIERHHQHAEAVESLAGRCSITVKKRGGSGARLEGAFVARVPGRWRLRAWKASQAVLDVTRAPEGLWVWTAEDVPDRLGGLLRHVDLDPFGLWIQATRDLNTADLNVLDNRDRLAHVRSAADGDFYATWVVDQATGGLSSYRLERAAGSSEPFRLELEGFRSVSGPRGVRGVRGIVIATRMRLSHSQGTIEISLHDPQINAPLRPGALSPPARAVRQE